MKKCLSDIGDQHNFKQRFGWIQEFKTDTFSYIISKFGPNLNFDNPLLMFKVLLHKLLSRMFAK